MPTAVSSLSLFAIGVYLIALLAAGAAWHTARGHAQQAWHGYAWIMLAGLFAMLMVARWYNVEELIRTELRESLRASASYDARRKFQQPIAASLVVFAAAACFWWAYRTARSIVGRRNIAVMVGLAAGGCMVVLIALRMVSLHFIDALLYGPLKLNWIADLGLSAMLAGAAIYYIRILRSSP